MNDEIPDGLVLCNDGRYAVDIGAASPTYGWLLQKGWNKNWVTCRKAADDEIARAKTHHKIASSLCGAPQPEPSPQQASGKEAAQSPTWDEVDAIRKGKSDIDLAQEIWRLRRQSKLLVQLLKNFRSAPSNEETINATTVHPEKGQAVTMEPRPMAGSVVAPVSSTEAPDLRDAVIALLNAIQTVATLDWLAERANKHRENRFYEGANECDSIIADLRHADGGAKTKE